MPPPMCSPCKLQARPAPRASPAPPVRSRTGARFALLPPIAWLLAALLLDSHPRPLYANGSTDFGAPGTSLTAFWTSGKLLVSVQPLANEGYIQIARRVMEKPEQHPELARFNDNRGVMTGVTVKVPLALLKPELRGAALRAMYPDDELTEEGWTHTVTDPLENLIQIAEVFTGTKRHFKELARRNRLKNPNLLPLGTQIAIPLEWIPDQLGFRPVGLKAPLRLETDRTTGRSYALYAVEPNETLYSILIRFTDREQADEINRLSALMVRLNRLRSPERVRPGKVLRIPLEWISEDFLIGRPEGSAPQIALQPAQPPSARPVPPARPTVRPAPPKRPVPGFSPIHVILDPGHGGVDPGAVYGSRKKGDLMYEHEVVFDIALRLTQLLETRGHRVYPLVRDAQQTQPLETLSMAKLGKEVLLTTPPYPMTSVHVAVNLRVYLVDAIYRRLIQQGVLPEQIVLLSIHGDALAPTLRGAMIYYPDFRLRTPEFGPKGRPYRARNEARAHLIRFEDAGNRTAQAASQGFATLVLQQLDAQQVRVSRRKSVRSFYYRDGVRTLPAVLRYSRVPQSILVEVANLNNPEDRRDLLLGSARQRIAQGLAGAVDAYRLQQAAVARREE